MYLTGFDSRPLNTLYVDKNLDWHNLLQAFSRTNRVEKDTKPFGNIVCFRNLQKETDDAKQDTILFEMIPTLSLLSFKLFN